MALQERIALLSFCSYVQWVPDSDVVVAQVLQLETPNGLNQAKSPFACIISLCSAINLDANLC